MIPFSERAIQAIAESKIQIAIDDGEFDKLAGLGRPFDFDDSTYNPYWWIRRKIERESLTGMFHPSPTIKANRIVPIAAWKRRNVKT